MATTDEGSEVVATVRVEQPLTRQMVDDLLTTAFDGGSNYWCREVEVDEPDDDGYPSAPRYACTLVTDDGERRAFDIDKLVAGLALVAEKWPRHWADWVRCSGDATTADVIIQAAVFGELVYG